jgi:hypothetical protein
MVHPIYRVTSVQTVAPYTLKVKFDDDSEQVINLEPVLSGEIFGPLRDPALFNQVRIDPEVETIVSQTGRPDDGTDPSLKTPSAATSTPPLRKTRASSRKIWSCASSVATIRSVCQRAVLTRASRRSDARLPAIP